MEAYLLELSKEYHYRLFVFDTRSIFALNQSYLHSVHFSKLYILNWMIGLIWPF